MPMRWRGWYAFIPAGLAILTSLNTVWNGFVADDSKQVVSSLFIRDAANLPLAFTTSVWSFATSDITFAVDSYYRPLFNVLFTINYALFGLAPWGWHLMNVLIHAAVSTLVFVAFRELSGRPWLACTAAALFSVHPVHAESIAWVSGITDPLMAVFLLAAFYFYLRYQKRRRYGLLAAALGFYFLALLSKETALALPLLAACCEVFYFKESGSRTQRIWRAAILGALFAAPTAGYFLMRYHALGGALLGSGPRYETAAALLTVPLAIIKYLKLMAVPAGFSYQHLTAFVDSVKSFSFVAPLALVIVLGAGVTLARSRLLVFSALWFILTLAPALAVLRQLDPEYLVADRYLYVPSIGVSVAAAIGLEWLARRRIKGLNLKLISPAIAAALVVVFGVACILQNRVWRDELSLYRNCVEVEPKSPAARTSLSHAYFDAGMPREADTEGRTALELDPQFASAHLNLSYYASRTGRLDRAIEYLEEGVSKIPETPMTRFRLATMYLNLGLLYAQQKNFARGEENLLKSIEIWPRAVGWYYAGQFYFDQGRYDDALTMYNQTASRVTNRFAAIHLRLAWTYDKLGQPEQARASYERFLEMAPAIDENRPNVVRRISQL